MLAYLTAVGAVAYAQSAAGLVIRVRKDPKRDGPRPQVFGSSTERRHDFCCAISIRPFNGNGRSACIDAFSLCFGSLGGAPLSLVVVVVRLRPNENRRQRAREGPGTSWNLRRVAFVEQHLRSALPTVLAMAAAMSRLGGEFLSVQDHKSHVEKMMPRS